MWRTWLELARVSNLPTVWTNTLAAWFLAGGRLDRPELLWLLLGTSFLYTGGMFLNDAADAKWDRDHKADRPIVQNRVSASMVWLVSTVFILGGGVLVIFLAKADWLLTLALVAAIVFYDLYHKPWKGSVIIMGACRLLLYLVAMSAAGLVVFSDLDVAATGALKGFALGCYIVGLSLAARKESKPEGERKRGSLAQLGLLLLVIPGVVAIATESQSPGWWMLGVGVFAVLHWLFVFRVFRLMQSPPPSNIGRGVGLLLAGIPLVDALFVLSSAPFLAVLFVVSVPLLRLWQRKIAAT